MASNQGSLVDAKTIDRIAQLLLECQAVLFTSGAGMSVSSGLGTFRGSAAATWPPLLSEPKLDYTEICNPIWFNKEQGISSRRDTANFGYAFWTHQHHLFSTATPHAGYAIAKKWSGLSHVQFTFSFTSNIDGHWRRSGWDPSSLFECHGSIDYMQCTHNCLDAVWPTNDALNLAIDSMTNCVTDPLPICPHCHRLARPNILMFNDWHYAGERYNEQIDRYEQFKLDLSETKCKLLIFELGAGTTIPSVRNESETMFNSKKWISHLVRINPCVEHSKIDARYRDKSSRHTFEVSLDALTALLAIDQALSQRIKE